MSNFLYNYDYTLYGYAPIDSVLNNEFMYLISNFGSFARKSDIKIKNAAIIDPSNLSANQTIPLIADGGSILHSVVFGNYAFFCGNFTKFNDVPVTYLAKVNLTTGEVDPAFSSSSNQIYNLAIDGNSLYICGFFDSWNNVSFENYRNLIKIDALTGELDSNFVSNAINGTGGRRIIIRDNYIFFIERETLHKCDKTTGTIITTYTGKFNQYCNMYVDTNHLYVSLYIDQLFHLKSDITKINVLNDSITEIPLNFPNGTSLLSITGDGNGVVYASCGQIGSHSYDANPSLYKVKKINSNTNSVDETFQLNNVSVSSMHLDNNGKLYISGIFTNVQSVSREGLARVDANTGQLDLTFDTESGFRNAVYPVAVNNITQTIDNKLLIVGIFAQFKNVNTMFIASEPSNSNVQIVKLSKSTEEIISVTELILGPISGTWGSTGVGSFSGAVGNNNDIFIYGGFGSVNNIPRKNVVKFNALTEEIDLAFDTSDGPVSLNADSFVYAMTLDNNAVYISGKFDTCGGLSRQYLAKLNSTTGAVDTQFDTSVEAFGSVDDEWSVWTMLRDSSNGLYLGGYFAQYKGYARNHLVKVNATTAELDMMFDTSDALDYNNDYLGYGKKPIALDNSGNLYVGGYFSSFKNIPRQNLVKVNAMTAAVDLAFDTEIGPDYELDGIVVDNSGSVYISGYLENYKNTPRTEFAKLNASSAALDAQFSVNHASYSDWYYAEGNFHVDGDNLLIFARNQTKTLITLNKNTGLRATVIVSSPIANIVLVGSTIVGAVAVDPTVTPILLNDQPLPEGSVVKNSTTGQKFIKIAGDALAFKAITITPPVSWGWSAEGIADWEVLQDL